MTDENKRKASLAFRYSQLPKDQHPNAWVKCEICRNEKQVSVLHCMREGWPTCCEVGGIPQAMALLVDEKTRALVSEAAKVMSLTSPITGVMNWPLFYEGPRFKGVNIPGSNVNGG